MVFATVQPVIFVLLFTYVFGGAIFAPGYPSYVDYLMPGIFVQTITFGSMNTGVGLSEDLHTGIIERFRSLPMARSAVLGGRTGADLVRNVFVVALDARGRLRRGLPGQHRFRRCSWPVSASCCSSPSRLSWVFAIVGLMAPDAETAQAASFPILAPLVFASSAFVPVSSMPTWLQGFANHQPVSVTVNSVRGLMVGLPPGQSLSANIIQSLIWSIGLIAVCAPLAVRQYRKAA